MKKFLNWFRGHYGKGWSTTGAVIAIILFSILVSILTQWWIGLVIFAVYVLVFWTQRNTQ